MQNKKIMANHNETIILQIRIAISPTVDFFLSGNTSDLENPTDFYIASIQGPPHSTAMREMHTAGKQATANLQLYAEINKAIL